MSEAPWNQADYWNNRFVEGDTPWDLGEPSPILQDLESRLSLDKGATGLVPGCGRGHDALYFAEQGYAISAVDWSSDALDDLRVIARRKELEMETLLSSLWDIPKAWEGTFDFWVEHTFYCAIDPEERSRYVQNALRLLKPKGELVGVFFVVDELGDEANPPFMTTEAALRDQFEPHFEILTLEPSKLAPRGGFEWAGHFRAR